MPDFAIAPACYRVDRRTIYISDVINTGAAMAAALLQIFQPSKQLLQRPRSALTRVDVSRSWLR
jgi:hypothetical protein